MIETPDHVQVLEPGEVLVDRGVLAGEADEPAYRFGVFPDVGPGDHRLTLVWLEQGGQDRHCGRLAGAVRPEKAKHDSLGDDEVETGQGGDFLVPLDQTRCLDHVGHRFLLFLSRSSDNQTGVAAETHRSGGLIPIGPEDDWNHASLGVDLLDSRQ